MNQSSKNPLKIKNEGVNPFESVLDEIKQSPSKAAKVAGDEAKKAIEATWNQLLGNESPHQKKAKKSQGDLQEGVEINLSDKKAKQEQSPDIMPAIDYRREILHAGENTSQRETTEIRQSIEEIKAELKNILASSKELETAFADVKIETISISSKDVGKYHVNFFEWVLINIRSARVKIESSANWMSTVSSKANKKTYWNLSKKHGTSFMLSGERVVAQQVG